MSYATVLAGLHVRFATVPGIVSILDYVPTAIHEAPVLYSTLDRMEVTRSGQVRAVHYRIQHRMVFLWQDFEEAEKVVIPYVDSIPLSVEADPHLGGVIVSGFAEINECVATWIDMPGPVTYRVLDFYSDVTVK